MATAMAATRQPFAPLNGSRLQNLTSLKNRQNALSSLSSPSKRKASFDDQDAENVDPIAFLAPKKLKSPDGSSVSTFQKPPPTNFFLTKAPASPTDFSSAVKPPTVSPRRPILAARSPAPRLNTTVAQPPLTAPAGRSPTRKRVGILNRRKTASPFARVDPPRFGASTGLGFSIDAALSGTLPSYAKRQALARENDRSVSRQQQQQQSDSKNSWFFDIHEDTPEELATNLMEHSTCTLDISSDEESAARTRDQRGKENVPPIDDISQTHTSLSLPSEAELGEPSMAGVKARARASSRRRKDLDDGACDVDRAPLGEMPAEEFYAEGCNGSSVFLVPVESDNAETEEDEQAVSLPTTLDPDAQDAGKGKEVSGVDVDVDALMQKDDGILAPKATLLEPIEKAEENFQLWESTSDKGDE